jgi:hypothetical protein
MHNSIDTVTKVRDSIKTKNIQIHTHRNTTLLLRHHLLHNDLLLVRGRTRRFL